MTWLGFAIATAVLCAARDIFAKWRGTGVPSSFVALCQYAIATPIVAVAAYLEGYSSSITEILPALFGAAFFLSAGSISYFRAIEVSDLSLMIPLRSLTPLILLAIAPILLDEHYSGVGILGTIILVGGLYVVSHSPKHSWAFGAFRNAEGTKYMLLAVCFFAACAICEKIGIARSAPLFFTFWECLLATAMLGAYFGLRQRHYFSSAPGAMRILLPLGILFGVMMIFQSKAYVSGNVSYVVGIKRTSTLLVVLWGCLVFGEGALRQRLLGTTIALVGAVLIALA